MKKRIVSLLVCVGLIFSVSMADTVNEFADFDTEELVLFKELIQDLFYKDVTDKELKEAALKGMFQSLDPYSNYYNKEETEEFNTTVSGLYKGIGIKFEMYNGYVHIVKVFTNSPAQAAGLQADDTIIEINGEDIKGWSSEKVAAHIRGEAGTTVNVTVIRGDQLFAPDVLREEIQAESCEFDILDDDIAYIKIEEFNASTAMEVASYLHAINLTGYNDKLILDLRNNTGGYVDQAVAVARNFVPRGIITTLKFKNPNSDTIYRSSLEANPYKMVVLVNEATASASEILAGALQDNGVKLVGRPTYGKGVFQRTLNLKNGGMVKLTTGQYLTPSGVCIDKIGLQPDVDICGEEEQLQKAIEEVNKL
jgi:carboxyl-terminal processing protease